MRRAIHVLLFIQYGPTEEHAKEGPRGQDEVIVEASAMTAVTTVYHFMLQNSSFHCMGMSATNSELHFPVTFCAAVLQVCYKSKPTSCGGALPH